MPELPSGTVTFLFTDIQESTRLWEDHPTAMQQAVARHLDIMRDAVTTHGGVVFKTVGDAVQAAFSTAGSGLAAAIAAQQALSVESWPDPPGPLLVRMALHAGTATPHNGDYLAPSLNRLARLLAAGHGGQVLLTDSIRRLLDGAPPGVDLRDLGEHRLRDLHQPERVWQAVAPGLTGAFPPLRTLETSPHNLPAPPTPLIGRETEMAAVPRLFREGARLVTLTGPGGSGKTRLALEVGAELLTDFADGVWFLDLSGLTDPALLLPQIAGVLGLRESGEQPVAKRLAAYLAGKHILLILDNVEQFRPFIDLCRAVADLLAAAPETVVLATSRAPLRIRLEREFLVLPLPVPEERESSVATLAESPAVQLFVARARAARPGFTLNPRNAAAIAALCRRLDGLPLALELAAARVRALTPADILARLGDRLDLLADSGADRPDRQRTLEATVGWSYDLLPPQEQAAVRRLAVFTGGSTLEAAEAVLAGFPDVPSDPLATVTTLVEQGLLRDEQQPDESIRFRMLGTVRVFALQRLRECGEEPAARSAHARHYYAFAASIPPNDDPDEDETAWLVRLEGEHDNLRAAVDWMLAHGDADALAFAVTLWRFWWPRGYWTEAGSRLERALANDSGTPTRERATALRSLGLIVDGTGDRQRGLALVDESLALFQQLRDRGGEWQTLLDLSLLWASRDYGEALRYAERALAVARELGDASRIAHSLNRLGNCRLNLEEPQEAVARHREALVILERLGDERGIAETLDLLGIASVLGADPTGTLHWCTRAVAAWRAIGDPRGLASSLMGLTLAGHVISATEAAAVPPEGVRAAGEESLSLSREIGWRAGECFALWGYRGMGLGACGDYEEALPGAQEALAIAREIEHRQWLTGSHCALGLLSTDLGDWAGARRAFTEALDLARGTESLYWTRSSAGWLAGALMRGGALMEAESILDEYHGEDTPLDTAAGRLLWATAADLALARGDARRGLDLADRLVATAPGKSSHASPRLELLRGTALIALRRHDDADTALAAARKAALWCGTRPLLWRIDLARARLAAARGQSEQAEQAREQAAALIQELAASVPDDALRATFLDHALHDVPAIT
jgi:predicted ATPase/class 3 adenylate cyclase